MAENITVESLSMLAFMDERQAIDTLIAYTAPLASMELDIMSTAGAWTRKIRSRQAQHGVETFLHTYRLDTSEGVALMCLAEALLRIPDHKTADDLIQGTFEGRDWARHTNEESWLMSFSSWALLLTGKVADLSHEPGAGLEHTLKHLVHKMGEPVIREALRRAMALIGGQFVLGETLQDALSNAVDYTRRGYRFSFDILGEGARSDEQAKAYVDAYGEGIALIGRSLNPGTGLFEAPGISVKLSALHPRYQLTQRERVMNELYPRLKEIALLAKKAGITVALDAEESTRLDIELCIFEKLIEDPELVGWNGLGFVVQAYQKRAFYVIDWLAQLARKHGRIIPVRLVKGAYWDSEIKWAQLSGLPDYPVFTRKEHTDVSYLACASKLLSYRDVFYPQFATHNARTVASIMMLADNKGWKKQEYEFQRLHGMGEALHDLLLENVPSRIYAPVGPHKDLLAYLVRRLLENGANSSFVHLLMDESKTSEEILADPITATQALRKAPLPLPLPSQIYGVRKNSAGLDFGNLAQLNHLQQGMAAYVGAPLTPPRETTVSELDAMLSSSQKACISWSQTTVQERALICERAADLMEYYRDELVTLLASEAGKTLVDSVSEVREAADFCRYYAQQARNIFTPQTLTGPAGESNILSLHPRGIFACISPWNFPLAIFTGQVVAALACGNGVIAKPAEQTPGIAQRVVTLLHQAGIPRAVLQLVIGTGETIGAALVADKRVQGVAFTGGTDTAVHIAAALASRGAPLIPFIAETGGQNCMVVDSSALPEQAVDDIMLSAFGSAGQRCSSLRVVFIQDDIADHVLQLLAGAMRELALGDPVHPATDIGPVIDAAAQRALLAHIEDMKKSAKLIASVSLPHSDKPFVSPHVFEITSMDQLTREHFGPILHVIRFRAGTLPEIIDAINSTGYGLTFGVHSRIEEHVAQLTSGVRAGNMYINRSMIGATVGVQPFGGEGLSGTGPKAGGPHYLLRFTTERTLTTNTAAIGGNVALLVGK